MQDNLMVRQPISNYVSSPCCLLVRKCSHNLLGELMAVRRISRNTFKKVNCNWKLSIESLYKGYMPRRGSFSLKVSHKTRRESYYSGIVICLWEVTTLGKRRPPLGYFQWQLDSNLKPMQGVACRTPYLLTSHSTLSRKSLDTLTRQPLPISSST